MNYEIKIRSIKWTDCCCRDRAHRTANARLQRIRCHAYITPYPRLLATTHLLFPTAVFRTFSAILYSNHDIHTQNDYPDCLPQLSLSSQLSSSPITFNHPHLLSSRPIGTRLDILPAHDKFWSSFAFYSSFRAHSRGCPESPNYSSCDSKVAWR